MPKPSQTLRRRLLGGFALTFALGLTAAFMALDGWERTHRRAQLDGLLRAEAARLLDLAARRKARIMQAEFDRLVQFHGEPRLYIRLLDADGGVLAETDFGPAEPVPIGSPPLPGAYWARSLRLAGVSHRVMTMTGRDGQWIQLAIDKTHLNREFRTQRIILGTGLFCSLVIGLILSRRVLDGALRQVEYLRATAQAIARGDLARRVPVTGAEDELRELVGTFNAMLERMDTLVRELRAVTTDIAHDLRTPITRIRGHVEPLLTQTNDPAAVQDAAALVVEECDGLAHMIGVMLQIARLEAGVEPPAAAAVNLTALVREAVEAFHPICDDRNQRLHAESPTEALTVQGTEKSLQRALGNLLDNAVKFTPDGGTIRVTLTREGAYAEIAVRDTGPGISPADLPHVFERFYRAAHAGSAPGSGLGLSLVQAIVKAHGGSVSVQSMPSQGACFALRLPLRT